MFGKFYLSPVDTGFSCNTIFIYLTLSVLLTFFPFIIAADEEVEEIVVVGSQIEGATVTDILPVSVFSSEDIEALGIESGDELLENLPEMGQNEFAEANETGGINASRGDIGAYNLRNLGVGSTLVLLNGRRLVNSPGYQTEIIGGGYTPVSTVNSNLILTRALDRVEVLRDGASALYGADALAGVINNVTDTEYEGFSIAGRRKQYSKDEGTNDTMLNLKFGAALNDGGTHFTLNYEHVDKGHMPGASNERWSEEDLRSFVPESSAYRQSPFWASTGSEFFNNDSSQGPLGQFDMLRSRSTVSPEMNGYIDSGGEFQVFRNDDPRCAASEAGVTAIYDTGYGTCIVSDSGTNVTPRWSKTRMAWLRGHSERHNFLMTFKHDLDNGTTLYNELGYYSSSYYSERNGASQYPFKLHVGANSYYNPIRTAPSLTAPFDPDAELWIDNYRPVSYPRTAEVDKRTYRLLQGIKGSLNGWDYDGAVVLSKATSTDTQLSVSRQKMQEALFDPTPAGYNFLCDPTNGASDCSTNIERTQVYVNKKQVSKLSLIDMKFSNPELFSLPAGDVAFLTGFEYREEELEDTRSDLLNGNERFTHLINASTAIQTASRCYLGDPITGALMTIADNQPCTPINVQYPFLTGILGGTPSADFSANRDTTSIFAEINAPLSEQVSSQLALRFEDTSTSGSELVWKLALGWNVTDRVMARASAQTSFRAPDLVALTQPFVQRFNAGQNDYARAIGEDDSRRVDDWLYRRAVNNPNLTAETAQNISVGLVFEPSDELTLTADFYQITKDDALGNLGSTNEAALDFLMRSRDAEARNYAPLTMDTFTDVCGTAATGSVVDADGNITSVSSQHNVRVVRPAVINEDGAEDGFSDLTAHARNLGFCPAGGEDWFFAQSNYENLGERTIEGFDIGVYYDWESDMGTFSARYNGAFTTKLEQLAKPGSDAEILIQASESGEFAKHVTQFSASDVPITQINLLGWGDLLGNSGFFEEKHSTRLSWRKDMWSASITARHVGEFIEDDITLPDGTEWVVGSMTTISVKVSYRFEIDDTRYKISLGSTNITDESAPLADERFGFEADVHNDYGRSVYVDLRADF